MARREAVPGLVEVSGGAVTLAAGVRVDVGEFVDGAHALLDPAVRVDRTDTPAAARAGELLSGWCGHWVLLEREQSRHLRVHALEVLADELVLVGRCGEAVQAAHAAVRDEVLRGSAHRAIVRVHLAERNRAEAMHAHRDSRDALPGRRGSRAAAPRARSSGGRGAGGVTPVAAPDLGVSPSEGGIGRRRGRAR